MLPDAESTADSVSCTLVDIVKVDVVEKLSSDGVRGSVSEVDTVTRADEVCVAVGGGVMDTDAVSANETVVDSVTEIDTEGVLGRVGEGVPLELREVVVDGDSDGVDDPVPLKLREREIDEERDAE